MPKNAWIFLLATVLGALLMSYLWVSTERRNQLAALEKKSNFVLPASISPYKKVESIRHRGTSYIPTPSESLKSSFKLVRWVNDQKVMITWLGINSKMQKFIISLHCRYLLAKPMQ